MLSQRTCFPTTLFERRIQNNWLQEFLCAAFIATGKPWMEYGKWYTTQKENKKETRNEKCERDDASSVSNIPYALVTWARITTVSLLF